MNKVKGIKNWYYLAGGLCLAAVVCLDVIGGLNYPGYDWFHQGFTDLLAQDSYDVILCTVFVVIAACLAIVSMRLIMKFMKANPKLNLFFVNGVKIMMAALVVFMLILTFVRVPNAGSVSYLNTQNAELKALTEQRDDLQVELQNAINNSKSNNGNSDANANGTNEAQETKEVTDARSKVDAKNSEIDAKTQTINEIVLEPFMCIHVFGSILCYVVAAFGLLFASIGGMRKRHGGFRTMGIVGIVCALGVFAPLIYSVLAHIPFITFTFNDWFGLIYRVIIYSMVGFVAFYSLWIYAYEPPLKKNR